VPDFAALTADIGRMYRRVRLTVGLPAKSGVSGALMLVVPGLMGIAVWSPRLDEHGHSVRGIEFCRKLVAEYTVHVFDSLVTGLGRTAKRDPRRKRNQTEIEGVVALTWAASQGDLTGVRALVASGVDPGTADYDGRTALHLAAAEGQQDVVRYLLGAGTGPPAGRPVGRHPAVRCRSRRPRAGSRADPPGGPARTDRFRTGRGRRINATQVTPAKVVAVLLVDGWHRACPCLRRTAQNRRGQAVTR
jgi:hypothetical protein